MSIFLRTKLPNTASKSSQEIELQARFKTKPTRENLFKAVPITWNVPDALTKEAGTLFNSLNDDFKLLFNTIFWEYERFKSFCTCPSSVHGHHARAYGNLIHTLQVAETFLGLANYYKCENLQEGLLCALLHDAGKAAEYTVHKGSVRLSDTGKLLGHKLTLHKWLIEAKTQLRELLPETTWLFLEHNLTASYGLPDYAGYRNASTKIAMFLSASDRLSGLQDLYAISEASSGWGSFHRHLKTTPYSLETA